MQVPKSVIITEKFAKAAGVGCAISFTMSTVMPRRQEEMEGVNKKIHKSTGFINL